MKGQAGGNIFQNIFPPTKNVYVFSVFFSVSTITARDWEMPDKILKYYPPVA